VRSGLAWGAVSRVSQLAVQLLSAAVLARLLSPADFGIVNMSAVFLNVANALADFGIKAYVVQRKDFSERDRGAASLLGWLLGAAIFLAAVLAAVPLSRFYHEPRLAPVLAVQAVVYLLVNAASIHIAMITRALRFRRLAAAELAGSVAYLVAACGLAWIGEGYWSLVLGRIVAAAASLSLLVSHWSDLPPRRVPWRDLRALMRFGGAVTATGVLGQLDENFDNIAVGRFFGSSSLGLYAVSYNTAALPQKYVAFTVAGVANPVLARAEAGTSFAAACTRYVRYQVLVPAALAVAVGVLAPEVCAVLLGRRWPEAPSLVSIMSVSAALLSVGTTIGGILISRGLAGDLFRFHTVKLTATAMFVLVGARWGLKGVAVAFAVATACSVLGGLAWAGLRTGLGRSTLIRAAGGPAAAVAIAGGMTWAARTVLLAVGGLGTIPMLIVGAATFAGALTLAVVAALPRERDEIAVALRSTLRRG